MPAEQEVDLLAAFIQGDRKAFSKLFEMHYEGACRYIIRLLRDQDTAEEVVQSTFVNIWEKRENFRADISFKSYLFRSAYNAALNYLKHQKVVNMYVNKKQERIVEVQQEYVSYQRDFELERKINQGLEELPPQCQKVFRMSREDGLKYHEIADKLGISRKTVEVHMGKALKILREYLKEYLPILTFFLISL